MMAKRAAGEREWKCLSVRQPYAWAIINGAKDVENRKRKLKYVGRLHIHAALTEETDYVDECVARVAKHSGVSEAGALEDYRGHLRHGLGAIIGSVHMFGCAVRHESPWFKEGWFGYLLRDPEPLRKPVPCRGSPNIFKFTPRRGGG